MTRIWWSAWKRREPTVRASLRPGTSPLLSHGARWRTTSKWRPRPSRRPRPRRWTPTHGSRKRGRLRQTRANPSGWSIPHGLRFPYRLEDKAKKWPFLVEGMWHDGRFTYLRANAQESPALYEEKDGKPALVAYDLGRTGCISPAMF